MVHLAYLILRLHIRSLGYQQLGNRCLSFSACRIQWCPAVLHQKQGQGAQQLQYSLCQTSGQPRKLACIRHKHEMNYHQARRQSPRLDYSQPTITSPFKARHAVNPPPMVIPGVSTVLVVIPRLCQPLPGPKVAVQYRHASPILQQSSQTPRSVSYPSDVSPHKASPS